MIESLQLDKKSILCFANPDKVAWSELAKDCVAFANTRGGQLIFGIEDLEGEPEPGQLIGAEWVNRVQTRISENTIAVALATDIAQHSNGGMTLNVTVHANRQSLAATTDGRYYYRVGDRSVPVMPDTLPRLLAEKDMFVWEIQTTRKIPRERVDSAKLAAFLAAVRASDRVSSFVKEKGAAEILDHYFFTKDEYLTNLGVLWIGLRNDRAQLRHAPVIQFIKYDERERKVRKLAWDDYSLNPLELIEAVWREIPEWREFTEFPDGMFRKSVPHYEEVVIRELLANALVHRPYTTAGDLFINLHPDYLEIHNPGRFPLGVTATNILHQTVRRNDLRVLGCHHSQEHRASPTAGAAVDRSGHSFSRCCNRFRNRPYPSADRPGDPPQQYQGDSRSNALGWSGWENQWRSPCGLPSHGFRTRPAKTKSTPKPVLNEV